jgi:hypothetical protein
LPRRNDAIERLGVHRVGAADGEMVELVGAVELGWAGGRECRDSQRLLDS